MSVKQVTRRWMTEHYGDDTDGIFEREGWVIYILRSLPARRKRWIYLHEFQHFLTDAIHEEQQR